MKMIKEMELRRSPRLAAKRTALDEFVGRNGKTMHPNPRKSHEEYTTPTLPTTQSLDCSVILFACTIVLAIVGCVAV
jgi:hypothetical protein